MRIGKAQAIALALLGLAVTPSFASAATETIIHRFSTVKDGLHPEGALAIDGSGAVYGTAHNGGLLRCAGGCGVVFRLKPPATALGTWAETVLYSFTGGGGAANPTDGVVAGPAGVYGGAPSSAGGWVFSVTQTGPGLSWQPGSLLYGTNPSGLAFGPGGFLYGIGVGGSAGSGAVFAISTFTHQATVFYDLQSVLNGGTPAGRLTLIGADIFGTTVPNGSGQTFGTVFELKAPAVGQISRPQSTIYKFPGGVGGSSPCGGLIGDASGNLYGCTTRGGTADAGVVLRLTPPKAPANNWHLTVLHNFTGDGRPQSWLVMVKGVLYGTTTVSNGGVFSLAPPAAGQKNWRYKVLHTFTGGFDGSHPQGSLIADAKGALYGTTFYGGGGCPNGAAKGCGTVFKIVP